jgi:biotin carboxyl carrier protein
VIFDVQVEGRRLRVEVKGQEPLYTVMVDGRVRVVDFRETGRDFASLILDGHSVEAGFERRPEGWDVYLPERTLFVELAEAARGAVAPARRATGPLRVTAPMPGKIVRVLKQAGDEVEAGQGLVVMEAMKMENELRAPRAGRLSEVAVREGQAVEQGALVAVVS